ncbi:MAG: cation transporting ATPase C-terminal domain-containing protein, partial [Promethearchaeota archaeon]
ITEIGLTSNRMILLVYLVDIFLVSILFLFPPLTAVFGLVQLELWEWVEIAVFGVVLLLVEEARKRIGRSLPSRSMA